MLKASHITPGALYFPYWKKPANKLVADLQEECKRLVEEEKVADL